jgi:hypothetical protein
VFRGQDRTNRDTKKIVKRKGREIEKERRKQGEIRKNTRQVFRKRERERESSERVSSFFLFNLNTGHSGAVTGLAFLPDSTRLISIGGYTVHCTR